MMNDDYELPYITASEIGQYHYCSLSWYMKKCGYRPKSPSLQSGIRHHHRYGTQLYKKGIHQRLSTLGFLIGSIGLTLFGILIFNEVFL